MPEVWIVDLAGGAVERSWDPGPDGYRSHERLERGATIALGAFPEVAFVVEEIVGPAHT